ncbi:MAG: DUF697 domain-containing protein [Myxococcales bacterium]|nr:DUF697 domain-containing protein [Myxococcales bacterium]
MSTDANEPKATRARRLIKRYALGGIAPGLLPFPLIDAGLLLGVQLKLIHHLAKVYGVAFSKDLSRSLISALVGGGAPISLGASLGKLVPGYGQFVSPITGGLLGGASTYAVGQVFLQHFESGGTFLTFDPEKVRAHYASELEKGKTVVRENLGGLRP